MEPHVKRHGLSVLASTITSLSAAAGVGWFLLKGPIVAAVAAEVLVEVGDAVDSKLAPMQAGFEAIIQGNIASIRREIARMEYKRDSDEHTWTEEDAVALSDLYAQLVSQQAALKSLQSRN